MINMELDNIFIDQTLYLYGWRMCMAVCISLMAAWPVAAWPILYCVASRRLQAAWPCVSLVRGIDLIY